MMNRTKLFSKIASAFLLSFWATYSVAQDSGAVESSYASNGGATPPLSLFESIEVTENQQSTPSRPTRETRATMSEPVFTLVGTSRIGSKSSAILRHQNGEIVHVSTALESTTQIAGYEGFSAFELGAGTLSVLYPSDILCVEHKQKGVSCSTASNTALLELVNAQALARTEPISNAVGGSLNSNPETSGSGAAVGNPFEALRTGRAADSNPDRDSAGDARNGRFTPRRINPADVPPGMRVVSTPFGDRLVEQ
jgi:hypothetical protein